MPATETPEPAAWMSTFSPASRWPTSNNACVAVSQHVGNSAACSMGMSCGTWIHVAGRGQAQLGVAAVLGGTDDGELAEQVALAGELRSVGHARQRRVDDDPIAHVDRHDIGADLDDGAGDIHARDVRVPGIRACGTSHRVARCRGGSARTPRPARATSSAAGDGSGTSANSSTSGPPLWW